MKTIEILGRSIELQELEKEELKGLSLGDKISFNYFRGEHANTPLLFLEPNRENPTPSSCAVSASRLSERFGKPIVFLLPNIASYERQRLIDKNVYFITSSKFLFLPTLLANESARKSSVSKRLSPVAQYILLYHLQTRSVNGLGAREIAELMPYSYENITLGLTCLADFKLCEKVTGRDKQKRVFFSHRGRELWMLSEKLLTSPVVKRVFCDYLESSEEYPVCNANALANYTMLNPDARKMIILSNRQLKELEQSKQIINANPYDGNIVIEVWKYPVVSETDGQRTVADKLSLALSMRDDDDPRIEKEIERMINEIEWKD